MNPSQTKDMNELNKKIEKIFKQFYDAGADSVLIDWKRNDIQKLNKEATKAIQDLLAEQVRLAEGRGRVAVLTAVKEWADDTEVVYNRMIESELEKIAQLKESTGE